MDGRRLRTTASGLCIAVAVVSACSTIGPRSITDRYGFVTVDVPPTFSDQTDGWNAARWPRNLPEWMKMTRLLALNNEPNSGCTLYEIEFAPGSSAATLSIRQITERLIVANRGATDTRSWGEKLRAGEVTALSRDPKSVEILEQSGSEYVVAGVRGWKVGRRMTGRFAGDWERDATETLLILPMPKSDPSDSRKRYLKVHCFTPETPERQRITLDQMDAMQQSIRFNQTAG